MGKNSKRSRQLAKRGEVATISLPDLQLVYVDEVNGSTAADPAMVDAIAFDQLIADTAAALEAFGVQVDRGALRALLAAQPGTAAVPQPPYRRGALPISGPSGEPAEIIVRDGKVAGLRAAPEVVEAMKPSRDGWWLDPDAHVEQLDNGRGFARYATGDLKTWDRFISDEEAREAAAADLAAEIVKTRTEAQLGPRVVSITDEQRAAIATQLAPYQDRGLLG